MRSENIPSPRPPRKPDSRAVAHAFDELLDGGRRHEGIRYKAARHHREDARLRPGAVNCTTVAGRVDSL